MVRELLSVAKLVTMALRRFPDTFSNAACAAPLKLLRQLWPLFATESLRCGHGWLEPSPTAYYKMVAYASKDVACPA